MPSPIFNLFNNNRQSGMQMPGPFGNIMNLMTQFNQFRQNFQGDPQAQVQQLRQSGQMSDEMFNRLSGMARQFQQLLGRR